MKLELDMRSERKHVIDTMRVYFVRYNQYTEHCKRMNAKGVPHQEFAEMRRRAYDMWDEIALLRIPLDLYVRLGILKKPEKITCREEEYQFRR